MIESALLVLGTYFFLLAIGLMLASGFGLLVAAALYLLDIILHRGDA